MTASLSNESERWRWQSRLEQLERRMDEIERDIATAKRDLATVKREAERFQFDTRSRLDSNDNNFWLVAFAAVNVLLIAAAVASRH